MKRTFFRSCFIIFLCLLTLSCSFAVKTTGDIEFALPNLGLSRAVYSTEKPKFKVSLVTPNDRYLYNEEHEAGSIVYIPRVPYGDYTLSLKCNVRNDVIEGSENVSVRTGKNTVVNIQLKRRQASDELEKPDVPAEGNGDNSENQEPENPEGPILPENGESDKPSEPELPNKPDLEPENQIKDKGTINLFFMQGPSPAIDVTVKLYKAGNLINTYSGIPSNGNYDITDIDAGNDYKIVINGINSTHNYDFTQENITVEKNKVNRVDVKLVGVPFAQPDPRNGIYCVNGLNGVDEGNDGRNAFKTITGAIKSVQYKGGAFTLLVSGTIEETSGVSVQSKCTIKSAGSVPAKVNVNIKDATWITLGAETTLDGLDIVMSSSSTEKGFAIKVGDSVKVTLGENMKIRNVGDKKDAVSVGSGASITLSSPSIIDSSNYVQLLNGGKIYVNKGFSSKAGAIILDMEGNGSNENKQAIFSDEDASELAAVTKKFSVLNNKYLIGEDGILKNPNQI